MSIVVPTAGALAEPGVLPDGAAAQAHVVPARAGHAPTRALLAAAQLTPQEQVQDTAYTDIFFI